MAWALGKSVSGWQEPTDAAAQNIVQSSIEHLRTLDVTGLEMRRLFTE